MQRRLYRDDSRHPLDPQPSGLDCLTKDEEEKEDDAQQQQQQEATNNLQLSPSPRRFEFRRGSCECRAREPRALQFARLHIPLYLSLIMYIRWLLIPRTKTDRFFRAILSTRNSTWVRVLYCTVQYGIALLIAAANTKHNAATSLLAHRGSPQRHYRPIAQHTCSDD